MKGTKGTKAVELFEELQQYAKTKEENDSLIKFFSLPDPDGALESIRSAMEEWYGDPTIDAAETLLASKYYLKYTHKAYPTRVFRGLNDLPEDVLVNFYKNHKKHKSVETVAVYGVDATTTSITTAATFGSHGIVLHAPIRGKYEDRVLVLPPQFSHNWFNHYCADLEYRDSECEVIVEGPLPYRLSKKLSPQYDLAKNLYHNQNT